MQCEIVFQLLKHLIGEDRNTSHNNLEQQGGFQTSVSRPFNTPQEQNTNKIDLTCDV